MGIIKYFGHILSLPILYAVLFIKRLAFERQLWVMRHQAACLIRGALRTPDESSLRALLLYRHKLRQFKYTFETDEDFQKAGIHESSDGRRLIQNARFTLARIEDAIMTPELALEQGDTDFLFL